MGLKSTETVTCRVKLSVTNAFLEKIKSAVKKANFGKIISDKTFRCAELVSENWADNGGFLGNLRNGINSSPAAVFFNFTGIGAIANASWTDVTIEYRIKVDMYHLVRYKKGRFVSLLIKKFRKLRRKLVCKEMEKEIKKGFEDKISEKAGFFSGLSGIAVKVANVEVH